MWGKAAEGVMYFDFDGTLVDPGSLHYISLDEKRSKEIGRKCELYGIELVIVTAGINTERINNWLNYVGWDDALIVTVLTECECLQFQAILDELCKNIKNTSLERSRILRKKLQEIYGKKAAYIKENQKNHPHLKGPDAFFFTDDMPGFLDPVKEDGLAVTVLANKELAQFKGALDFIAQKEQKIFLAQIPLFFNALQNCLNFFDLTKEPWQKIASFIQGWQQKNNAEQEQLLQKLANLALSLEAKDDKQEENKYSSALSSALLPFNKIAEKSPEEKIILLKDAAKKLNDFQQKTLEDINQEECRSAIFSGILTNPSPGKALAINTRPLPNPHSFIPDEKHAPVKISSLMSLRAQNDCLYIAIFKKLLNTLRRYLQLCENATLCGDCPSGIHRLLEIVNNAINTTITPQSALDVLGILRDVAKRRLGNIGFCSSFYETILRSKPVSELYKLLVGDIPNDTLQFTDGSLIKLHLKLQGMLDNLIKSAQITAKTLDRALLRM